MKNRYPGKCSCGAFVDEGEGTVNKADGRWQITCDDCAPVSGIRYEVQRVYWDDQTEHEMHEPAPILFGSIDEAKAFADRFQKDGAGWSATEVEQTDYLEIHKIELRGARSAFPAGFVEMISLARARA